MNIPYQSLNSVISSRQQFVDWLREVAPYIHTFRGRTFVIGFGGELVKANALNGLVQDVAMLNAMGMQIVLVHGSRPQVQEQLALRQVTGHYGIGKMSHLRITDPVAGAAQVLEMVKTGMVSSLNGVRVPIVAESVCLHGDGPNAIAFAETVSATLKQNGIAIRAPRS